MNTVTESYAVKKVFPFIQYKPKRPMQRICRIGLAVWIRGTSDPFDVPKQKNTKPVSDHDQFRCDPKQVDYPICPFRTGAY